MCPFLPDCLVSLAKNCLKKTGKPLYLVGGCVRDYLAGFSLSAADYDVCAPVDAESFSRVAKESGFDVDCVYKNTGTVKISIETNEGRVAAEYTSFRSDRYVRGVHTPVETFFTDDISLDAKRRDFTCNAVYYDLCADVFTDPLNGIADIKEKRIKTADNPDKVFGEDGLRLLRLARFVGTTGFTPEKDAIEAARKHAHLIKDVSPERVFAELKLILTADEKYQNEGGVYEALRVLDETRVLDNVFPKLTQGRNMTQRADFHSHDVLEHSLRAAAYAKKEVRLAALLHDIGKPTAFLRDGRYADHPNVGEKIAREALTRLKAPHKTIERVCTLTKEHMYDYNLQTKEPKLRRYIVEHAAVLDELLLVKQADYTACKDDKNVAPCVLKWQELIAKMREEGVPFSLKELAVRGDEIAPLLPSKACVGKTLNALLLHCAVFPKDNVKARLIALAPKFCKDE